ncbi:hypothetical protein G6L68_25075 [Agrobacterium fabrum]|uniref:hypothetical protein n=1 Tax=Agrobacterium fabrum TaxID=1176649 RepID=UPI000F0D1732|nr:hypothetical protein [Agrobacterium fabrum]AYM66159.1 hypothetical protein At12D13_50070 [Agrobacterium fabrum]NTE63906.1 hypothetical protein [Agrobacterium fabrum]
MADTDGPTAIRRMLAEHGTSKTRWIAERLDLPVETVEEFAAELRGSIVDLVPSPIIKIVRELHAAEEGSPDHAKLSKVVRKLAAEANAVLFRMASNRIAAQVPAGAFNDIDLDVGEDIKGYDPVDIDIGLQGKKNPAG